MSFAVPARARTSAVIMILLLPILLPSSYGGEKINLLMAGHIGIMDHVRPVFETEPLIRYTPVPARDPGGFGVAALDEKDLVKMIRLYFPRTYDEMKSYDILILTSPEYYLFTPKQDQWMYDAINEGMGGLNDGSVFSIVSGSIALRVARKRSSTSGNTASCSGFTSGNPKKVRASSGVHSMSTLNFIAIAPFAALNFDRSRAKTHVLTADLM